MAKTPCETVADNISDAGAPRGDARHRRDVIGFERMLHAEQETEAENSKHADPIDE